MTKPVFCLMGPTAIGKTDLACELSMGLPLEIINVDSSLMYQELNIGAAKPEADILKRYPHHLVNCCSLSQVYSVANFCRDANSLIQEIWARDHYPLLVGGTMMYFHALQQGLAQLPQASAEIREELLNCAQLLGWQAMHDRLFQVDAVAAAKIHPHDKQRILRGLEIYHITGKPWSQWLSNQQSLPDTQWVNMALLPDPREWLHQRIATRLNQMLELGLLDEVQYILGLPDLNLEHPALKSVGYRQAITFLQDADTSNWSEKILFATRQLAKRQMTWIRGYENKHIFLCPDVEIKVKILALMQEILDNS